jgi:uncharacterized membrane protein YkoI
MSAICQLALARLTASADEAIASMRRPILRAIAIAAALAFGGLAARADEERHDHDAARRAVERGEIKPLAEILTRLRDKLPGEVIRIEVERKQGRWLYELRLADANGRLYEAYVDGATAEIVQIKRK